MQGMNFPRRPFWTPSARAGAATPQPTAGLPAERANLQGLEVSDSTWDEWVQVQQEVQARRSAVAQGSARKTSLQ